MPVAGLVMGILSVSVFFWAGPAIGGLWSASKAASLAIAGEAAMPPAWPIWVMGLSLGTGIPFVSMLIGIAALRQNKGIAIAGIVTSGVGALLGFLTTMIAAFTLNIANAAQDKIPFPQPADADQAGAATGPSSLDEAEIQARVRQALEAAKRGEAATDANPEGAKADIPDTLMPGQTPSGSDDKNRFAGGTAEKLPAEAPVNQPQ